MVSKNKLTLKTQAALQDNRIRVLFVEDHKVLREALIALLEDSEDVVVSDTASTAEEALQKLHKDLDLVILDISLPGRDGLWLTRKIKAEHPFLPVLVLSMHEEPNFVLKALESGVDGYLTKWAGEREIVKAVRAIMKNGSYLQARIAPVVVDAIRRREARRRQLVFSEREREIARYLAEGLRNIEIAQRVSLSVSTVKSGLRSLYSKLHVNCRSEAVAALAAKGIARPD